VIKEHKLTGKHTDGQNSSVKSVIDFYRPIASTDKGRPNLPMNIFDG